MNKDEKIKGIIIGKTKILIGISCEISIDEHFKFVN